MGAENSVPFASVGWENITSGSDPANEMIISIESLVSFLDWLCARGEVSFREALNRDGI